MQSIVLCRTAEAGSKLPIQETKEHEAFAPLMHIPLLLATAYGANTQHLERSKLNCHLDGPSPR
jgi:hypothetical protein